MALWAKCIQYASHSSHSLFPLPSLDQFSFNLGLKDPHTHNEMHTCEMVTDD